jgi:hypothetical protein
MFTSDYAYATTLLWLSSIKIKVLQNRYRFRILKQKRRKITTKNGRKR